MERSKFQQALDAEPDGTAGIRPELSCRDITAISRTFSRYALATDTADSEMLVSTCVPQAIFTASVGADPSSLEVHGSTKIAAYVVKTRQQHGYSERHFITNMLTESVSPSSAHAEAYFLVTRINGGTVVISTTGSYQADLVRGDDQEWRIARIHIRTDTAVGPL